MWALNQAGLLTHDAKVSERDREEFSKLLVRVKEILWRMNRRTIDPNSMFVKCWDIILILALLFTAFLPS